VTGQALDSTSYTLSAPASVLRRCHLEILLRIFKIYVCVVLVVFSTDSVSKCHNFNLFPKRLMILDVESHAVMINQRYF
jgi:hypothetical protein